jgi:hypothetical protein
MEDYFLFYTWSMYIVELYAHIFGLNAKIFNKKKLKENIKSFQLNS